MTYSKRMFKKTIIIATATAVVLANSLICLGDVFADSSSNAGQDNLVNFLYAAGAYQCLKENESFELNDHNLLSDSINIGSDASTLIKTSSSNPDKKIYVGAWMRGVDNDVDNDGMLTCSQLMSKLFASIHPGASSKITEDDIKNGMLKGVYTLSNETTSNTYYCKYKIKNKENNGFIKDSNNKEIEFYWPQGFIRETDYDTVTDKTNNVKRIGIVYDGNLVHDFVDGESVLEKEFAKNQANKFLEGKGYKEIALCKTIIQHVGVWYQRGQTIPIQILNGDGAYKADLNSVWAEGKAGSTSSVAGKIKGKNGEVFNIAAAFSDNIATKFFDGKNPKTFLDQGSGQALKYTLLGRYLYNGDGKGANNCNGKSIAKGTEGVDLDEWDPGLSHNVTTKAYDYKDYSWGKEEYITKISDTNKAVALGPWDYNEFHQGTAATICSDADLVSKFNSLTPPLGTAFFDAADTVQGYLSPMSAEEANNLANTDNTPTANTCMNSGGAGSLGWIVCPILDFMSSSANGIYNDVLEPNLQVESGYFNQTETREAWGIFQTIANTLFIILVLIVVFSQLTGVGIDNYGIKKILPKLIVAAVLINLSYLICVICVDLSNIIGNGLQNIFSAINVSGADKGLSIDGNSIPISGGAITALVILGSIAGAYAVYSNPAFLITLLISALGVLISVLFLFVLLAGRKAAIVVLTILSPIVFILYMLPNTKKLFDKWLKLWEAMLLLYPICGLLIGGGNFVSQLLLAIGAGDDVFTALTAMAIGILPIFFVPTLLKSAFAAMGTIGSSIAGFGNRLRSGATGRLRNSERVKNAQERSQARQKRIATQRRAGIYIDKNGEVRESRRPSARIRRKIASTENGLIKLTGIDRAIGRNMGRNMDAFLREEASMQNDLEGFNLESARATFAGASEKIKGQRVADQQTLISTGKISGVNPNSPESLAEYHKNQLSEANTAKKSGDIAGYNTAMDRVKAVQNLLSTSDKGRSAIQENLESAITNNENGGLIDAASHLLANYGDKYKSANRGAHRMIADIAFGKTNANGEFIDSDDPNTSKTVKSKINDNTYAKYGASKYTAESIGNADEGALEKLENSLSSMSADERNDIAKTSYEAINNPNIHVKPEIEKYLKSFSSVYTPPANAEDIHRTKIETQNQAMIDSQQQIFQANHQMHAAHVGRNTITGFYPVPGGYREIAGRDGYYTDNKGHTYDAINNEFS